jgi:hypothetical protein
MKTVPNIPDPDGFYEALLTATQGLSESEREAFLLRLVLLLANQVGDQETLFEAIAAARAIIDAAPR